MKESETMSAASAANARASRSASAKAGIEIAVSGRLMPLPARSFSPPGPAAVMRT
jgi:hypothetical protein